MIIQKYSWLLVIILLIGSSLIASAPIAFTQDAQKLNADAINLSSGYRIEPLVSNLSVPTTLIFDGQDMLIAESGFLNTAKPRVLRIKPDGSITVIASEGLESPVTGLLVNQGKIYVSHRTKVSVVENGKLRDIVTGFPSLGDHQNNQIVMGSDGKIYMGQGTSTNSGVVGEDNYIFGWLQKNSQVHEIPCKDITLTGENFETDNPLTEADDKVSTGAYKPFGQASRDGEVIKGDPKCGGSIVRFNPDGSGFELVAWGLRNPFGLELDSSGTLWATFHGADVRGSRSINNDPDYLIKVEQGAWYGWPEYFDGQEVTAGRFNALGQAKPRFLWKDHPSLTKPYMTFDSHSATNGFDFAPKEFGFEGDAFIAMYGSFLPVTTGLNVELSGFNVVRANMKDRKAETFASNKVPGPAYLNRQGGFNRPSDVVFGPDNAMYIVDWGAATLADKGLELVPGSGAIWRIYPEGGQALRPNGPVVVAADLKTDEPKEPIVPNIPETYKAILPQWLWVIVPVVLIVGGLVVWLIRRKKRK
jgi:glucose/arabinose dehydrogenase